MARIIAVMPLPADKKVARKRFHAGDELHTNGLKLGGLA